ncbi:hypothetical protein HJC23_002190 [Cyclotella cryptica]|uniref:PCI domain-containing protein n=1 Tax=Cyclotella cryptica TaxID=29204 RepID=A0ABD3Q7F5_9STRA|eukprot:CCRYP_008220-RA/>CCRYP_008220-RA protein AED:0.40 eAED:0.40 QI:0/-1/0/1/-1/1/1/0/327
MTAPTNVNDLLSEFNSPSLSSSLLQSLLHRLLSHPSIHNGFVDVLNLPSVQAALENNPQREIIVRTVELFGFGTIEEYYELKDAVWDLNEAQLEKLRMLSVVSIARRRIDGDSVLDGDVDMIAPSTTAASKHRKSRRSKGKKSVLSIPYSELMTQLRIPADDIRKLEDLLIQCIYANLLSAKLDQHSKCLVIEPHVTLVRDGNDGTKSKNSNSVEVCGSILSRDLNISSTTASPQLPKMITRLETFLTHSEALLTTLEQLTHANATVRKHDSIRWREVNRLLSESKSNAKFGSLERAELENTGPAGERDRREVKRSKMQAAMMQRFS